MKSLANDAGRRWWQAVGITSAPTVSTTTTLIPEMSLRIENRGPVVYSFSIQLSHSTGGQYIDLITQIDGVGASAIGEGYRSISPANTLGHTVAWSHILPISAGSHKIDMLWTTAAGTVTGYTIRRCLTVWEL